MRSPEVAAPGGRVEGAEDAALQAPEVLALAEVPGVGHDLAASAEGGPAVQGGHVEGAKHTVLEALEMLALIDVPDVGNDPAGAAEGEESPTRR